MSIREWLAAIGLEHLASRFETEGIGVEDLTELTEGELSEGLGVVRLGDRKRIARAIATGVTPAAQTHHDVTGERRGDYDRAMVSAALDECLTEQCALALQSRRLRAWLLDKAPAHKGLVEAVCLAIDCGALDPLLSACDGPSRQRADAHHEGLSRLCGAHRELAAPLADEVIGLWCDALGFSGSRGGYSEETARARRERAVTVRGLVRASAEAPATLDEGRCPANVGLGNIYRALLPDQEDFEEVVQQFLLRQGETIGDVLDPRFLKDRIALAGDEPVELTVYDGLDFHLLRTGARYGTLLPDASREGNSWRIGLSMDERLRVYLHAEDDTGRMAVNDLGIELTRSDRATAGES